MLLWLLPRVREPAHAAKVDQTRVLVEAAWSLVQHYDKQARDGRLSAAQAQAAAIASLKELRYGQGDYFWVNDTTPRMIMHPTNPALDGKDLSSYRDPDGLALFVEMAKVCGSHGQATVRYRWAKPGSSVPVPKISYVKLYSPWLWIVGTGIYVEDVEAELRPLSWTMLGALGAVTIGALLFGLWMALSVSRPVQRAVEELVQGTEQVWTAATQAASASQSVAAVHRARLRWRR
jgi:methyl-accepting chemotaxis protein